jgi:aminoglycoside 2''-phosphotransferase
MHHDTNHLPNYTLDYGQAPTVERAMWLGAGDFCDCYLVNDRYVFRFAKHAAASAAMQVERCLLPMLQELLTVKIPQIEFAGRCDDTGEGMMGYQFLSDEPLKANLLESLPSVAQHSLVEQMVAFTHQLHAVPLELVRHCTIRQLEPLTHLTRIMEEGRTQVALHLSEGTWDYYENLLDEYTRDPALHTYQPALLHGDLSPDHFLGDPEQATLTGVIDFGDVCSGDPAWDLIYIYEDYGLATFKLFISLYDPENTHLLERKIQIYQQLNNVDYCLSVLAGGDETDIQEVIAILEEQGGDSLKSTL